jgi:hypothetical protein
VKKVIAVMLLLIYLVSTTEAYQLFKIPMLFEHFSEHKKQHPEMTVMSFLKMHYDHPAKDADYETDQKLPFVRHVNCFSPVFTAQTTINAELNREIFNISAPLIIYKNILYKSRVRNTIWQPPRLA